MCKFSSDTKARLGNTLIFIAKNASHPSKTSALKLLYIMEETMVIKYGCPFLGLPFELWGMGPVQKDVYAEISDGGSIIKDYINIVPGVNDVGVNIVAKKDFDEDEFSDLELSVMREVMKAFGKSSAEQLIKYLHREDSLWYKTAKASGMLEAFENGLSTTSDIRMELGELLSGKDKELYEESLMIRNTANEMMAAAHV